MAMRSMHDVAIDANMNVYETGLASQRYEIVATTRACHVSWHRDVE
jgi:hypothetical protein